MSDTHPLQAQADARWQAAAPDLPPFPRPPTSPAPKVHYVGMLVRGIALAIDVAILALCAGPLFLAGLVGVRAGFLVLGIPAPIAADETLASLASSAWGAMAFTYFTLLHRGHGQTIGKAALDIQVRSHDLEDIGILRSLVRTLGYFVSSTFFGIGFLIAAVTAHKRAWHDYIAGTCVVRVAREEG